MHLTIKERVELVLMSGADGATNRSVAKKFNRIYLAKKFCFNKNVCYYYLNCFICFGALFMAHPVLGIWSSIGWLSRTLSFFSKPP